MLKRYDRGPSMVLFTTCLGVLMAALDVSVINLALPHIEADLRAGVSAMQWVVDAYNLCYASLILTGGTLGDLYGRRRIFVLGAALFLLGSLASAWAPDASALIAGRALTGVGAALEFPASLAILSVTFPDPRARARAIGIWASCHGLAFVIGPTLGGLLVDRAGWRSIFLCTVPAAALAIALSLWVIPESAGPRDRQLDPAGQILAVLALGALSLGAIQGTRWGWGSEPSLICAAIATASVGLFLLVEARSRDPLLPLDLFRNRAFSAACVVAGCMTFGIYAMLFLVPLYLESVRGVSTVIAGAELLPMSLTFLWISPRSGGMASRLGPRAMMTSGMALMGLGLLSLGGVRAHTPLWLVEGDFLVLGLGLGLNTGPLMSVAMANVAPARSGTGSGVINMARMVGATLGVAVLGALFAAQAGQRLGGVADFMSGFRAALWGAGGALLFGTLIACRFIGRHSLEAASVEDREHGAAPPEQDSSGILFRRHA